MRQRHVLRTLGLLLAFIVLCVLATGLWCAYTEAGRQFLATRIERAVTGAIPGRMQIGKITSVDGSVLHAQNVRFFHADGRCLLTVDAADVDVDFSEALLHGRLAFDQVAADGGFMILSTEPAPDGRLSFEAAVNAPSKPGEPHDPHGGLHYALRSMHMKRFRLIIKVSKDTAYHLRNVKGSVGVYRIDTPGAQIQLERIQGDFAEEILGQHVTVKQLDGWVHGKEPKIVDGKVALRVGDSDLTTRLEMFDREKEKIVLRVAKKEGGLASAATWLLKVAEGITDSIKVVDASD